MTKKLEIEAQPQQQVEEKICPGIPRFCPFAFPWATAWRNSVTFLNSRLGIWFLTTIVAGLITWYASGVIERATSQRRTDESVANVTAELCRRLTKYRAELHAILDRIEKEGEDTRIEKTEDCSCFYKDIMDSYKDAERPIVCAFPELSNHGVLSLIVRLEKESPQSSSGDTAKTAIAVNNLTKASEGWNQHSQTVSNEYRKASRKMEKLKYLAGAKEVVNNGLKALTDNMWEYSH
jgi:hypothetical protein